MLNHDLVEMSNSNLRESDLTRREEGTNGDNYKISPKPKSTTSSWTKLKDPRIVRVSRAFGGKDRHSKVYTVRGLRDRRVRLSVPTAIQLYDLQDRLGLNQPSKVVDWLLDVAKHEIDELPPLQMPSHGNFFQGFQSMINDENVEEVKTNINGLNWEDYSKLNLNKSKEKDDNFSIQSSNHSSMFNNLVPNGSFLKLNPSNLSLSQFGCYGSMASHQQEDSTSHNFNSNVAGSQLFAYPPSSHHHNNSRNQFDTKQLNFEMLSSSSSNLSSPLFTLNHGMMIRKPFNSEENEQDKRDEKATA